MLKVFIALGKQMPKNKAMIEDTEGVAKLLAKYNCTLLQGGANVGLMGQAVQEFQKYSDDVVMIVPEAHKGDLEGTTSKECYVVESESDRLRITIGACDMMVVLPGGTGTLAELAFYNETRKSREHDAHIVVVNTKGFYNDLFKFHKTQIKNGFMAHEDCKFEVIKSAKELEPILQKLITEKQAQLQQDEAEAAAEEALAEEVLQEMEKKAAKEAKSEKPKTKAKAKAEPKPVAEKAKKPAAKKTTAKKAEPKKAETKKNEVKKPAAKKTDVKKEAKKPAAEKVETKKAVTKKVEVKKAEVKKPVAKKTEAKKPVEKKVAEKPVAKKATAKKAEPKKAPETKKTEAKKPAAKKPTTKKAPAKTAPKAKAAK